MDKDTCDLCGKAVSAQAMHRRVGFTPGSRANKVCGACLKDKLPREERLRFAKAGGAARKRPRGQDEEPHDPTRPPDELRFGPG